LYRKISKDFNDPNTFKTLILVGEITEIKNRFIQDLIKSFNGNIQEVSIEDLKV
jgi:hypothetical protein